MTYRVREARVLCLGPVDHYRRMWIAERLVKFGPFSWWWPVLNGEWRRTCEKAKADAAYDHHLRQPEKNFVLDS